MTDRSFSAENRRSTQDLATLVASLEPADLEKDTGDGWSVADVLGHTAFWDQWTTAAWQQAGDGVPTWDEGEAGLVNEALLPLFALVDPSDLADYAVAAAEELDTLLDALTDAQVDGVRAIGREWMCEAAGHRDEHIAQVRSGLGRA